jgi:replication-associated recombination protein RarA
MKDEERVEYRIEIAATFDMDIFSSVWGPPGLGRSGIEEIIEREWTWISADKNILQESRWELIRYDREERPSN